MGQKAVIYCRISQDATEQGLGVQRQEDDCRKRAEREGLEVTHVYTDNDTGASNLSKKKRPEYDAMLEAVRAGGIDVILAYSTSRLTRKNREFEDLIVLHEETGVTIKTVASGDDDLSTAQGRMVARIKASVDAAEAETTGERVKRQIQKRVESGMPRHNRYKTFGYNRDWTLHEEESDRIADAYRRVIAGESVQSIVERWKADGVVVGGGKTLYHSTVKNIIQHPLYGGYIVHHGERYKSAVPTVVDEATWNAAQTALSGRGGTKTGRYARRYLLGGIVSCGLCGFTMPGKARKNENYNYECARASGGCGKLGVSGKLLEPLVLTVLRQAMIVGYKAPEVANYSTEIDALKEDIAGIQEGIKDRSLRVIDVRDTLTDLTKQLRKCEAMQEEATAQGTGSQFDDWDEFMNATIYEQVATVRRHINGVVIQPATSKAWNPARVDIYTQRGTEINGAHIKPMASSVVVAEPTKKN